MEQHKYKHIETPIDITKQPPTQQDIDRQISYFKYLRNMQWLKAILVISGWCLTLWIADHYMSYFTASMPTLSVVIVLIPSVYIGLLAGRFACMTIDINNEIKSYRPFSFRSSYSSELDLIVAAVMRFKFVRKYLEAVMVKQERDITICEIEKIKDIFVNSERDLIVESIRNCVTTGSDKAN